MSETIEVTKVWMIHCKKCRWTVSIPDTMLTSVNMCLQCAEKDLSSMEFTMDEWTVLERYFAEKHGQEIVECP